MKDQQKELAACEAFIKKDEILYADIADMTRHGKCRFLYAEEDGVLFQDDRGFYNNGTFVFAADDVATTKRIIETLSEEEIKKLKQGVLACHKQSVAEYCKEKFEYDRATVCFQTVYPRQENSAVQSGLRFEKATEKQLPKSAETYALESPDSLKKLVESGKIVCAYKQESGEEEKFVGYIGCHPEGSMGLLYVFPEYRRQGYAEALERYQISAIYAEGRTPYAHIIEDNFKSFALQQKLGAIFAEDKVLWMSNSSRKKD